MDKAIEVGQPAVQASVHHILKEIERNQSLAAADHLIVRKPKDDLPVVAHELMNELPQFIKNNPGTARTVFTTVIRIGLNLVGREAEVAAWTKPSVDRALSMLRENLRHLETSWRADAINAINDYLADMSSVNSGDSLPALMAERIQKKLGNDRTVARFIDAYAAVARQTVYWRIVEEGYGKFGNDYARGLETLRHLGFAQVSTNPVLAAKAFDEESALVRKLKMQIDQTPRWKENPRGHGHDMVVAGTLLALWSNLEIFRPLAVLVKNRDYMISFQLNPNVADDLARSVDDARRVYELAREHLTKYDQDLGVEKPGQLPPNIVFKVAGSSPSARQITKELNALGIGTNHTVTFSVAQETRLLIDALEGKAEALKAGNSITRTYETNMGGRLVSHLREEEAKRILVEIAARKGEDEANRIALQIAKKLNLTPAETARVAGASKVAEKADIVCAYKNMKSLAHEAFLEAVAAAGLSDDQVKQLEMDLRKAGTLVAKRVYLTFYEQTNRQKWEEWLSLNHHIDKAEAAHILDSMDVLPASKRIPEDTLDTMVSRNMCNTEFPNHARAVQLYSEEPSFNLEAYREAILQPVDVDLVKRLSAVRDFVRAYQYTDEIRRLIFDIGATQSLADPGFGGVKEEEWRDFGPVWKTMNEFKEAYDKFLERCIQLASIEL
ncbi:MAG TPA: transaldolase family protein [Candidatus Acidoferrum sp.]|nr:transaldolase family protein [Candidatus Acidoferrum sp.]